MAEFTPSKKTAQDFNDGVEYVDGQGNETGDAVQAETINNLVESALYTQEQAEGAVSAANGAVDTANNALTVANGLDGQIKTANSKADMANTTSQEAKNIAEEAKEIATDAQKGVGTKVSVGGEVVATFDADTKVNKAGDTMTGPLNFANRTPNSVGDDVEFGDCDVLGSFGIRGKNGETKISLIKKGAVWQAPSDRGDISYNGTTIRSSKSLTIEASGESYNEGLRINSDSGFATIAIGMARNSISGNSSNGAIICRPQNESYLVLTGSGNEMSDSNRVRIEQDGSLFEKGYQVLSKRKVRWGYYNGGSTSVRISINHGLGVVPSAIFIQNAMGLGMITTSTRSTATTTKFGVSFYNTDGTADNSRVKSFYWIAIAD